MKDYVVTIRLQFPAILKLTIVVVSSGFRDAIRFIVLNHLDIMCSYRKSHIYNHVIEGDVTLKVMYHISPTNIL